jgi:endonuclease/exonuclease/phosphatase family metal-dependent hydrolase
MSVDFARDRRQGHPFHPLLDSSRRDAVVDLAARSPDAAANIEEMAIVKRGSFALHASPHGSNSEHLRVLVWNIERGKSPAQWAAIEAVRQADVLLLCEVDDGMARSNNFDVAAELAARLGLHYAFAPNYFELTRGTLSERLTTRGRANARGFHGNAILSRWPLLDVRRLPLPVEFDWFRHYERRIGTRVALRATLATPGEALTVAVAHLEAFASPAQRARQMRVLMDGMQDAPRAIVGGDFNTLGVRPSWGGAFRLLADRTRDAHRLTRSVVEHEPLFEEASRVGFYWEDLNRWTSTWRLSRILPSPFRAKLDWILGRNVNVVPGSTAVVRAEVAGKSRVLGRLSDHDGLTLSIRLGVGERR